jgi:hypothetical protein
MDWFHKSSVEWLKARSKAVTATAAADWVSAFAKMQKAGVASEPPAFIALWAEKTGDVDYEAASVSTGAAARGHILEPYAIQEFNSFNEDGITLYHWDDCFIHDGKGGFSPDAMSIQMPRLAFELSPADVEACLIIGEVKSYAAKMHMAAYSTDKMLLNERKQIAMAFAVLPKLVKAYLIFYNPRCRVKMFYKCYTRDDLKADIDTVRDICELYSLTAEEMEKHPIANMQSLFTEEEIWQDYTDTTMWVST